MLNINPFCNLVEAAAIMAIDWGHRINCIHLFDPASQQIKRHDIQADPSSMAQFINDVRQRFPQGEIVVASEQSKGALVNQLLDYDFVRLYAINPHAAAKFRKSLHPSGTKTDAIDSSCLLRMVFTHTDRIRPLNAPTSARNVWTY